MSDYVKRIKNKFSSGKVEKNIKGDTGPEIVGYKKTAKANKSKSVFKEKITPPSKEQKSQRKVLRRATFVSLFSLCVIGLIMGYLTDFFMFL